MAFLSAILSAMLVGCVHQPEFGLEEYRMRYDKPLVSGGAQFAALPPAVQNTIRAEAGSASIEDITKDTGSGRVIYRVTFQNSGLIQPLTIAADGSLLDQDMMVVAVGAPHESEKVLTGGAVGAMSLNDLPPAAVKGVQTYAPDGQVDTVVRQISGNQITYLVTFKDRMHPPVQVTANGTILPEPAK
jgi:hypothetical protein